MKPVLTITGRGFFLAAGLAAALAWAPGPQAVAEDPAKAAGAGAANAAGIPNELFSLQQKETQAKKAETISAEKVAQAKIDLRKARAIDSPTPRTEVPKYESRLNEAQQAQTKAEYALLEAQRAVAGKTAELKAQGAYVPPPEQKQAGPLGPSRPMGNLHLGEGPLLRALRERMAPGMKADPSSGGIYHDGNSKRVSPDAVEGAMKLKHAAAEQRAAERRRAEEERIAREQAEAARIAQEQAEAEAERARQAAAAEAERAQQAAAAEAERAQQAAEAEAERARQAAEEARQQQQRDHDAAVQALEGEMEAHRQAAGNVDTSDPGAVRAYNDKTDELIERYKALTGKAPGWHWEAH